MPIFNSVISGGGSGGGGDKITALLGSNAQSVTTGDKVILNTPALVDTGYCTEYVFQPAYSNNGQWAIFFGVYMMYVDTSGHPIFFKHDTVRDKLDYLLTLSGVTLKTMPNNQGENAAVKVTYNETTKRFAIAFNNNLSIYQVTINSDSDISVNLITTLVIYGSWGGIAQDTDTLWYMTTLGDFDTITVCDFTYENSTFTLGSAYTHTNTAPTFSQTADYALGFSSDLTKFSIAKSGSSSTAARNHLYCGAVVNKTSKQITYGQTIVTVDTLNNNKVSIDINYVRNDGKVLVLNVPGTSVFSFKFEIDSLGEITNLVNYGSTTTSDLGTLSSTGARCGVIHQTGNIMTCDRFAVDITEDSYKRTSVEQAATSGGTSCSTMFTACLSSTGVFIWPYQPRALTVNYGYVLSKWNNGNPVRGDSYLTPIDNVGVPMYFDGTYLYTNSGVFTVSGGELVRYSSAGVGSSYNQMPIIYTSGYVAMACGRADQDAVGLAILSNGTVTGATLTPSVTNHFEVALDARLDNTYTGFLTGGLRQGSGSTSSSYAVFYASNGSIVYKSPSANTTDLAFFDSSDNLYMVRRGGSLYSVSLEGTTITYTELFATTAFATIFTDTGVIMYKAIVGSRQDNYQVWYKMNDGIYGITKLDIANSSLDVLPTPTALGEITGTVYTCWFDLSNRLVVRASDGIYVFAYTNHDISTLALVRKYNWGSEFNGPASINSDLTSYTYGNETYRKVADSSINGSYTYSADRFNGKNFSASSLTGIVNEEPYIDENSNKVVDVMTVLP